MDNNNLKFLLGGAGIIGGFYVASILIAKNQKKLPKFTVGSDAGLTPEQRYEKDKKDALNITLIGAGLWLAAYFVINNIDELKIVEIPTKKHYRAYRLNKLKFAK